MHKALMCVSVLVVACAGYSATSPDSSLNGKYILKTLNGGALPVTLLSGIYSHTVMADTIFVEGSEWVGTMIYSESIEGGMPVAKTSFEFGEWTRAGTTVTFKDGTYKAYTGTFTASGLNLVSSAGNTFVFAR